MRKLNRATALAAASALALTLAACGDGDDDTDTDDNGAENGETDTDETDTDDADTDESDTDDAETDDGAAGPIGDGEELVIGVHSGWEEGIAASYLWANILEEQGFEVSMETAEAAVVYTGLSAEDYDFNLDVWLPLTHGDYMEEYDELEDLGVWYEDAPLTIAVNEDAPIDSLDELADNADEMGGRIVGIEAGAGLTRQTQEEAIPTYGLEDMEFVISSTPAMLAELQSATDAGENIVVTLWRPHWAYDAFPVRDLEDPEGAMVEPDDIHSVSRPGFADDHPEVAEWIGNFTMTDDELHSLENIMFNELDGDDNEAAVEQWLEENPDYVDGIING